MFLSSRGESWRFSSRTKEIVTSPSTMADRAKNKHAGSFPGARKKMQSAKRQIVAWSVWRRAVTSGADDRLTHNFRSEARGSIDQTLWNSKKLQSSCRDIRTFSVSCLFSLTRSIRIAVFYEKRPLPDETMEKRRKARRVHRNVYRILFLLFFFLNVRLSCLPFSKSITDREVNKTDRFGFPFTNEYFIGRCYWLRIWYIAASRKEAFFRWRRKKYTFPWLITVSWRCCAPFGDS